MLLYVFPSGSFKGYGLSFSYTATIGLILASVLMQAGGETLLSEIHKRINSIWNKGDLSDQWKESIIVPISKKEDTTDCSNCRGISLLSILYKILSNTLSMLAPYIDEVIRDHQCGFRCNRLTTDYIFCIRLILGKIESTMRQFISYSLASKKLMIQWGGKYCAIFS
jgi:hypothetical protein